MATQQSFFSLAISGRKLRAEKFLNQMTDIIPWQRLIDKIEPFYPNGTSDYGGRKVTDLLLIFKIHLLQQWFGLSDPAMEDAIYDRISFQKFLNIDIGIDNVPDETVILRFRHLLEKHNLSSIIFNEVNSYLEENDLLLKEGTITDATLISAPTSTKNKKRKRDQEMPSTKKGKNYYFGMKSHIGVQTKGKPIIHSIVTTTAKDHDSTKTEELLHGDETSLFGDKAYDDKAIKRFCRNHNIFYGITNRAKSNKKLSNKQKKRNKQFSSVRAKVEHPFQIIKHLWGYRKVRYNGLQKNTNQLQMLSSLANLYMVRKILPNTA
jgi:IS5 family transposase